LDSFVHVVTPGTEVDLAAISPAPPDGVAKHDAAEAFDALAEELGELQELMFAANRHSLLIVLQGMDTSGKDGAVRHVLKDVNPAGCRVASFKQPTALDLAHDFLWRIHRETPERGQMVVFNRSHYEDVVVVRVKRLDPPEVWGARYDRINEFERLLTDAGTVVLKFFLHISPEEQAERLTAREKDVEKAWKLNAGDWVERRAWAAYMAAYEDAIARCSTETAPWHVVPADKKWFRNLAIVTTVVEALRPLKAGWIEILAARGEAELAEIAEARTAGVLPAG
jgi:PPK2 family polyphosphate:nucleotide phosphotransferase